MRYPEPHSGLISGVFWRKKVFWIISGCTKRQIPAHDPEISHYFLIQGKQTVIHGGKCTPMDAFGRQNRRCMGGSTSFRKRRPLTTVPGDGYDRQGLLLTLAQDPIPDIRMIAAIGAYWGGTVWGRCGTWVEAILR
jgi:hypothetical protein